MLLLEFGDVFTYSDGKQYVYLAMIDQVLYAALIVNPINAKPLISLRDHTVKNKGEAAARQQPLFCFVELKTSGYENHIATLARTDDDKQPGLCMHGDDDRLCYEDLNEIRDEIILGNVPKVLKEHIKTIEVNQPESEDTDEVSFTLSAESI